MTPSASRRVRPTQARAARTVDGILDAAAALLPEVGFEGMSTNMVCKRAGVTPPTLYRYFSDKYAVLAELGARLMDAQNEALYAWARAANLETPIQTLRSLLEYTVRATEAFPSGVWVLRALRATPALSAVRLDSHQEVARFLAAWIAETRPGQHADALYPTLRVAVDVGYAAVEMTFDETGVSEDAILEETATMLGQRLALVLDPTFDGPPLDATMNLG